MKKCDLSNIRRSNKTLDWKRSIGAIVPFEYNGQVGEFKILEYVKEGTLKVQSGDIIDTICITSVQKGNVKKLLPKKLIGTQT